MDKDLAERFLEEFQEDSRFPQAFLDQWEALECLSSGEQGETLLVRSRSGGGRAVARWQPKCACGAGTEGELLGQLDHPALPKLLGEYQTDTKRCVVRSYIQGEPLSAPGLRERLTAAQIGDIALQLVQILLYLHGRTPPIIHRDIKPQNIILGPDGRVSLIDFGISRAYRAGAAEDTVSFGTRRFAPPEQYGFQQTDQRSDLYSLGAVICYLITGDVHPQAETDAAFRPLMKVAAKCMAFAPQQRYKNAQAVRSALLGAQPAGRAKRILARCAAALAALTVLALLGLGLGRAAAPRSALRSREASQIDFTAPPFSSSMENTTIGELKAVLTRAYGLAREYVYASPASEGLPRERADSFYPWPLEEEDGNWLRLTAYTAVKLYWPQRITSDTAQTRAGDNGMYPGINAAMEYLEDEGLLSPGLDVFSPVSGAELSRLFREADKLSAVTAAGASPQPDGAAQALSPNGFAEPLIEEAALLMLGKQPDERVTDEELAGVTALYIFGQSCASGQEGYYLLAEGWYAAKRPTGPIRTLTDLARMPNLQILCLGAQQITDITPLSGLDKLEKVELKLNSVQDITPLSNKPFLSSVGLNANPVSDLTPLTTCPNLTILDLCDASAYDPSVLARMGDFTFLDISNRTQSYRYLSGKTIGILKLGYTGIDSLSYLDDVQGLRELEIEHTAITSLNGLETHPQLTVLRLTGLDIADCSPLKLLPELTSVRSDEALASSLKPLSQAAGFTVIVE